LGEDLDSVSLKELQNLEQQIDTALKLIRERKVCYAAIEKHAKLSYAFITGIMPVVITCSLFYRTI
jgi:hypothetical protein